jgi:hypothetical protein
MNIPSGENLSQSAVPDDSSQVVHTVHQAIIVTHLPNFVIGSLSSATDAVAPYHVQNGQIYHEENHSKKRKNKKRCLKQHSTDPTLVCGRTDCKGSGNKTLCTTPEIEFITYTRPKKKRRASPEDDA